MYINLLCQIAGVISRRLYGEGLCLLKPVPFDIASVGELN